MHWSTHKKKKGTLTENKEMLAGFFFTGVGGTKLCNIIRQIGGKDLPKRKEYLGDQWLEMSKLKENPHYVILCAGSNDTDEADRYAKSRYRRGITDSDYRKEISLGLIQWYKDLKKYQEELVAKIRSIFQGIRIYIMPVLPRIWWGRQA